MHDVHLHWRSSIKNINLGRKANNYKFELTINCEVPARESPGAWHHWRARYSAQRAEHGAGEPREGAQLHGGDAPGVDLQLLVLLKY